MKKIDSHLFWDEVKEIEEIDVGEIIKRFREEALHISQVTLADMMNVSRSTVNKVELGNNGVTKDFLIQCSNAMNISIDCLLGFTEDPQEHADTIFVLNMTPGTTAVKFFNDDPEYYVFCGRSSTINVWSIYSYYRIYDQISQAIQQVKNSPLGRIPIINGEILETNGFDSKLLTAYHAAPGKDQALVRTILEIDEKGDKVSS